MANILVVEDEKNMQQGGHVCYTADDGMDALMVLKNHPMELMILGYYDAFPRWLFCL